EVHKSTTNKFSRILKKIKPEILIIISKLTFDKFKIKIGKSYMDYIDIDYIININDDHSYSIYKGDKKYFKLYLNNINEDDENKDSESEDYKNNNYMNEVY
ncbi:461_t:CDS:1, partial [Gigaspora rosea]